MVMYSETEIDEIMILALKEFFFLDFNHHVLD